MNTHATGTFVGKTWDEKPYSEMSGTSKLTHASVTNAFHGDIEGDGTLEYLMFYRDDTYASFIGLERVVGRIGNRSGSFVLQHNGVFENGVAKGSWKVVQGSGTGELRGLHGEGGFEAKGGQPQASLTLDYDFE